MSGEAPATPRRRGLDESPIYKSLAEWRRNTFGHLPEEVQLQEELADARKQLEDKSKEVEELRSELARERKASEKLKHQLVPERSDGKDVYDVILKTSSLLDFVSSARLQVLVSAESVLEIAKENRYQIVAVAGLFDKGKTFLINALWNKDLPSGKLRTTEGLSMLWIEKQNILCVDSAGIQAPVCFRGRTEALMDAQITEAFQFELLSRFAHHLLYIVSDFTSLEQRYVDMLHKAYVACKRYHPLVVVHNMKDTADVVEAEQLFEDQLKSRYEGIQHRKNRLLFVADREPPIHHVGLCRVPSKAAQQYNASNLDHLHSMFDTINVLGEINSLEGLLKRHIGETLPKHVIVTAAPETEQVSKPQLFNPSKSLKVDYEVAEPMVPCDDARYKCVGHVVIHAKEGSHIELKKRGLTSSLGEFVVYDIQFDPKVNVYDEGEGTKARRVIRVECPGVRQPQLQVSNWPNGVKIKITQVKAIDELAVEAVEPIIQTHGVWERIFEYPASHGLYKLVPQLTRLDHGVLSVVLGRVTEDMVPIPALGWSDMAATDDDGRFTQDWLEMPEFDGLPSSPRNSDHGLSIDPSGAAKASD